MRKTVISLLVLSFLLVPCVVSADQFQFLYRCNGSCYVSYAEVQLFNVYNQLIFKGHTDKYGRITVNLGNGSYRGYIWFAARQKWVKITLTINGQKKIKVIYI